jgi:hypothetical protein
MCGHLLSLLQTPAIGQVNRDAGRPEGVAADFGFDVRGWFYRFAGFFVLPSLDTLRFLTIVYAPVPVLYPRYRPRAVPYSLPPVLRHTVSTGAAKT